MLTVFVSPEQPCPSYLETVSLLCLSNHHVGQCYIKRLLLQTMDHLVHRCLTVVVNLLVCNVRMKEKMNAWSAMWLAAFHVTYNTFDCESTALAEVQ